MAYQTKITQEQLKAELESGKAVKRIAEEYGVNERNLWKKKAALARQGWSPEHDMTHTVPDGFHLKGTSTLYGDDGAPKLQWVKTNIDHERQAELMREAIEAMAADIPRAPKIKAERAYRNKSLVNQYTITDYHFGMLAWEDETGAPWDLKIAEDTLVSWFKQAIATSPPAENCVFAQIGDFLHWDGLEAVTPTSGHILDADTRFQKVVQVVIRTVRRVIQMLLKKYRHVHIIMAEGNHDIASSIWLREMFTHLYDGEPRLTVDNSADIYYCYEFGKTCLFYHHGHKKKVAQMDSVFVAKFREVYGRTEHHYAHSGHLHHDVIREGNLMKVEQHRTLAAPDAHASRGGWMSKRDAKVITYHEKYGEVARLTVGFDCIRDD